MPNRIDFELQSEHPDFSPALSGIFSEGTSARDFQSSRIQRFNEVAHKLNSDQAALTAPQLEALARRMVRTTNGGREAAFISSRLQRLAEARAMAGDPAWTLPPQVAAHIALLIDYADGPGLYDRASLVIGRLDDALLVDFAMDSLRAELALYAAFCAHRQQLAAERQVSVSDLDVRREAWEVEYVSGQLLERQLRHVNESSYCDFEPDHPFRIL